MYETYALWCINAAYGLYLIKKTHILWLWVLGEAKGLRRAAIRTNCLLPPPVLTPRTPASGVLFPLEPGVRQDLDDDLGVRLGVARRPGVHLGVWEFETSIPSAS